MKFKEMVKGEKYTSATITYIVKDGLLFSLLTNKYSAQTVEKVSRMDFRKIPWKPEKDEKYYFITAEVEQGFESYIYDGMLDEMIFNRIKVYKTKSEAIQAVKDLGWEV